MHMKEQYNIYLEFSLQNTLISQTNDSMDRSCFSHVTELAWKKPWIWIISFLSEV